MVSNSVLLGMAYGTIAGGTVGALVFFVKMIATPDIKWALWALVYFFVMAVGAYIARRVRTWL